MIAWSISQLETVPSTQDYIKEKLNENNAQGLVIQAITQTTGYGRRARKWHSPPGNLYLSLSIQPDYLPPENYYELSFVAALALHDVVADYTDKALLKWPNDLLIDDKKAGGLLIELYEGALIIGLGLNIVQAPDGAFAALGNYASCAVEADTLRDHFLEYLVKRMGQHAEKGFAFVLEEWLVRAHKPGTVLGTHHNGQKIKGTFIGLDEKGNLQLQTEEGRITLNSGDVWSEN